jgi:hypothetical protein
MLLVIEGALMDPLTNLYDRLRAQAGTATPGTTHWPEEPPLLQDWLRFWNDEDTDLGNLRNFEHWMTRARCQRDIAG